MSKKTTVLTITGPSGGGKSHLECLLRERLGCGVATSTTNRPAREGEVNGVHYHFVPTDEMLRMVASGEMAEFVEFPQKGSGRYYGLQRRDIEAISAAGQVVCAVVEPSGVKQLAAFGERLGWNVLRVFLHNPPEVLVARKLEQFRANPKLDPVEEARRMLHLIQVEIPRWPDATRYDLHLPEFGPQSQEAALAAIRALLAGEATTLVAGEATTLVAGEATTLVAGEATTLVA